MFRRALQNVVRTGIRSKSDFVKVTDGKYINKNNVTKIVFYDEYEGFLGGGDMKYCIDFIHFNLNLGGRIRSSPFNTSIYFSSKKERQEWFDEEFME
jgi:hypothetical protein